MRRKCQFKGKTWYFSELDLPHSLAALFCQCVNVKGKQLAKLFFHSLFSGLFFYGRRFFVVVVCFPFFFSYKDIVSSKYLWVCYSSVYYKLQNNFASSSLACVLEWKENNAPGLLLWVFTLYWAPRSSRAETEKQGDALVSWRLSLPNAHMHLPTDDDRPPSISDLQSKGGCVLSHHTNTSFSMLRMPHTFHFWELRFAYCTPADFTQRGRSSPNTGNLVQP